MTVRKFLIYEFSSQNTTLRTNIIPLSFALTNIVSGIITQESKMAILIVLTESLYVTKISSNFISPAMNARSFHLVDINLFSKQLGELISTLIKHIVVTFSTEFHVILIFESQLCTSP